MRILFFMSHPGFTRNYESTLRTLLERGHRVDVYFDRMKSTLADQADLIERLEREYEHLTHRLTPWNRPEGATAAAAHALRVTADYTRYLEPEFKDAAKLRERVAAKTPVVMRRLLHRPPANLPAVRHLLRKALLRLEQATPINPQISRFLAEQQPDIVLVTPLLEIGTPQVEYLRAARRAGLHTVLCVASWDNLTSKGLIQETPGLVAVWNDAQIREAVELHGVDRERVIATGAVAYDHWFDWKPSTTREEFCQQVGLRPDRPILLYVCSSGFIAPDETAALQNWISALRSSDDPVLKDVGVLVRPHPTNPLSGRESLTGLEQVTVWPRTGANPTDKQSRNEYFDSMYHSAGVVGINTSALIESAIVGRQTFTVLTDTTNDTQNGTLHFKHLRQESGGPLVVASDLAQHLADLADLLSDPAPPRTLAESFLKQFIRPAGLEVAAAPLLVDELERLAQSPSPSPARQPSWAPLARPLLRLIGFVLVTRGRSTLERAALALMRHPRIRRRAKTMLRPLLREFATRDSLQALPQVNAERRNAERPSSRTIDDVLHDIPGTGPLIAGPWLSSVATELTEWLPFLETLVERDPRLPERLYVVGCGSEPEWYEHVGLRYVDVSSYLDVPPTLVARRFAGAGRTAVGLEKQTDELSRLAADHLQLPGAAYLSADALVPVDRLPTPLPRGESGSRRNYVALRLASNDGLRLMGEDRQKVEALLLGLAAHGEVLVIGEQAHVGRELLAKHPELAHTVLVRENLSPQEQLEVIRSANELVGGFDGMTIAAALYGIPTIGLVAKIELLDHWALARVRRIWPAPTFVEVDAASRLLVRRPDRAHATCDMTPPTETWTDGKTK